MPSNKKKRPEDDPAERTRVDTSNMNAWDNWDPVLKPDEVRSKLMVQESSFATIFPKYSEAYLKKCWPLVKKKLAEYCIEATLDLVQGQMTVKTTPKTFDPFMICHAHHLIQLLARSVPVEQAFRIIDEPGISYDLIKMSSMCSSQAKFLKRRKRLLGPEGKTLAALQIVTDSFVTIQGKTAAVIGPIRQLVKVRRFIEDTMQSKLHPVNNLKVMIIKRELERDPSKRNENWERYLPHFKNKTVSKRKKPRKVRVKGEYTPFPPPMPPSKIDRQLEAGEYFLSEREKATKSLKERERRQREAKARNQERRQQSFVPPEHARL